MRIPLLLQLLLLVKASLLMRSFLILLFLISLETPVGLIFFQAPSFSWRESVSETFLGATDLPAPDQIIQLLGSSSRQLPSLNKLEKMMLRSLQNHCVDAKLCKVLSSSCSLGS